MRSLLILVGLLLSPAAAAQVTDEQLWFAATATHKEATTSVTIETIGRFSDSAAGFSHAEIGGVVTKTVAKGIELSLGYRHVADFDHGRTLPNEERLRQMVTVALGAGFTGRLRFEERFNSTGPEVGLRVRPQLRFVYPLSGRWALFANHESYFNFNDTAWGQRRGHERMRNSAGVTIPLLPNITADVGYLNQYRFGRAGGRDRMDHAATFTLAYGF